MTKKILITGGQSFLSKSIIQSNIFKNYQVWYPSHDILDLTNFDYVESSLKQFKPDFIIHTAWNGSSYTANNQQTSSNNIKMLQNLIECEDFYKKLIIFGSGIEFQKKINRSLLYYKEAKLVTALMSRANEKIIKLNIWGLFGKLEDSRRFISTCIRNCKENKDIIIEKDKLFDFFYIEDLIILMRYLINNPPNHFAEIDAVYHEKLCLSDIANFIKDWTFGQNKVIIKGRTYDKYIGLNSFNAIKNINFIGLREGIKRML